MDETERPAPDSQLPATPVVGAPARRRRWIRVLLWSLVSLPFLAILGWYIWDRQGVATLNRKIAHLEARGFATSLKAMAPPPVPQDQNAAPLYLAAFSEITRPRDRDTLKRMRNQGAGSISAGDLTWVEAWVAENKATISSLAPALTRPHCQFDFDRSRAFLSRLPEQFLDGVERLSDLLCAHALLEAVAGHHDAARQAVRHVLRLSESMTREPILAAQHVRFVMSGIAMKTVEMCIDRNVSEAELDKWASILPEVRSYVEMSEICVRGLIAGMAEAFKDDLKKFRELIREDVEAMGWNPGIPLPWKPALYYDLSAELTDLSVLAVWAALEAYRPAWWRFEAILEQARKSDSGWSKARGKFLSIITRTYKVEMPTMAAVAVVRAGIDFERAYIQAGRYPDYTPEDDPFTWEPLQVDLVRGMIFSDQAGDRDEIEDPSIRWTLKRRP